ncbi:MAG: hypothetical protein IT462_05265 [Planctomycetes bacterium]|nr:hypothetical protein [Planctomycetota bacterium]
MSNKHYRTPAASFATTPTGQHVRRSLGEGGRPVPPDKTAPQVPPEFQSFLQGMDSPEDLMSMMEELAGGASSGGAPNNVGTRGLPDETLAKLGRVSAANATPTGRRPAPQRPAMYTPEHIEMMREIMRTPHPLQALVKERQDALYAELGGSEVDGVIEGMKSLLKLGQRCLLAEADAPPPADGKRRPRPLVTAGEFIRATAELRRWTDKRDKLKEEALLRVAEEMQLTMGQVAEALRRAPAEPRKTEPGTKPEQYDAAPATAPVSPQAQPRAPAAAA